jgi:thioredoxin-like negative regulator of GroEL
MTGPEHYTRAEQLLREVRDGHQEGTDVAAILAAAQVHATLADAAASALIDETPRSDCFDNYRAWQQVAGDTKGGSA